MTTAAETFVFEAEDKIGKVRDYLITVVGALAHRNGMSPDETSALYRVVDEALDEIKALEGDFETAFQKTFGTPDAAPSI